MKRYRFARALKFMLFAASAVAVLSLLVMVLWNHLIPAIFPLHAITFWQALGLFLLSKLLFGGLRPPFAGRDPWRRRMMERWEHMTPEERENFKRGFRSCGWSRSEDSPKRKSEAPA